MDPCLWVEGVLGVRIRFESFWAFRVSGCEALGVEGLRGRAKAPAACFLGVQARRLGNLQRLANLCFCGLGGGVQRSRHVFVGQFN